MTSPSVSYTFTNGTAADATQVSQNFTDLINAMTDGTKSFSIDALTCGGTTTLNGAVTLGNATGDDITVNGYVASDILPKTTNTSDLGGSGRVWAEVRSTAGYFTSLEPITTAGIAITGATDGNAAAAGDIGEYVESNGSSTGLTSGQYSDGGAAGVKLTAGTWDIQAVAYFAPNAATVIGEIAVGIGTATGNSTTGMDDSRNTWRGYHDGATIDAGNLVMSTPLWRVNTTGSTTYYAKLYATFTTNVISGYGYLRARRVR